MDSGAQLEQLISQYQNLIFSICFRLTGDYFEAEDLAQDTFLSAYKSLADFDGANERAWLCRIATNKCIDYLKRAGRRSIPTDSEFFPPLRIPVLPRRKWFWRTRPAASCLTGAVPCASPIGMWRWIISIMN